jgi:hypothetical protein
MSYNLHPRQITGGPSCLESEKYDVTGKPDKSGQPNVPQIKLMLQKLLADRFQLKFQRDNKEMAADAITVTKGGVKFKTERPRSEQPAGTVLSRAGEAGSYKRALVGIRKLAANKRAGARSLGKLESIGYQSSVSEAAKRGIMLRPSALPPLALRGGQGYQSKPGHLELITANELFDAGPTVSKYRCFRSGPSAAVRSRRPRSGRSPHRG